MPLAPTTPMGRLGRDARGGHVETVRYASIRFTFTSTGAEFALVNLPAYAVVMDARVDVLIAFNGTAPTITVGTRDNDGAVDDIDELVDNNDVDLTATGDTSVTDKLNVLSTEPRRLVVTLAATAAPTAGEGIITVTYVEPSRVVVAA